MSRFELKQFGDPDFLRRVRPETLRELLAPHASFLTQHRFSLPGEAFTEEHLEALAMLLVSVPDELPAALLEALEMLDALTSSTGWTELQAAAREQAERLSEPGDGPGDVAWRVWKRHPQIVERIFTKLRLVTRRTLVCYRPQVVSKLRTVTPALCKAMAADLSLEFSDLLSSAACDITAFAEAGGHAFLIRHGEPMKRLGVYDECGRVHTRVIRPMKHDVAYVSVPTGELQVSGVGGPLQETYRSIFSTHLFGNAGVLQRSRCYTLEPIREGRNCLNCAENSTIESVRMTSLRMRRRTGKTSITYDGEVFDELERPETDLKDFDLERAQFQLRVRGKRRALVIELTPGRDTVAGDAASQAAQAWMQHCGFVSDHELEGVLASR